MICLTQFFPDQRIIGFITDSGFKMVNGRLTTAIPDVLYGLLIVDLRNETHAQRVKGYYKKQENQSRDEESWWPMRFLHSILSNICGSIYNNPLS